jgi:hypothetical protein
MTFVNSGDIDFQDLLQLSQQANQMSELTVEHEKESVGDTHLLLVGFLLLQRWTPQQITQRYVINEHELTRLLARLDRLKIIELLPETAPGYWLRRILGGPRVDPSSVFSKRMFVKTVFDRKFDADGESQQFLFGLLADDSIELLNRRITHLVEDYRGLVNRDRMAPISSRNGTSLMLATRRWGFPAFDALVASGLRTATLKKCRKALFQHAFMELKQYAAVTSLRDSGVIRHRKMLLG